MRRCQRLPELTHPVDSARPPLYTSNRVPARIPEERAFVVRRSPSGSRIREQSIGEGAACLHRPREPVSEHLLEIADDVLHFTRARIGPLAEHAVEHLDALRDFAGRGGSVHPRGRSRRERRRRRREARPRSGVFAELELQPEPPALLGDLRQAIAERRKLRLSYDSLKNEHSERIIWPLGLSVFGHFWLLTGWCELRSDFRDFRVDRISSVHVERERYEVTAERSFEAYVARM